MGTWEYAIASVLAVSAISIIGILALGSREQAFRRSLIYVVSFSAGAFFGDVFIHMLPEVVGEYGFSLSLSFYLMGGIAFSFVVEKLVRWRHCHLPPTKEHPHPLALMNLLGDGVHNFLDGLTIGASYLASIPVGIATTLAVVFHEIPQEIGDFGVLLHGGFTRKKALLFNFLTALTAVGGCLIALIAGSFIEGLDAFLVPFAAGGFLYIAGSDLIPEMHKELDIKRSALQLLALLLGIGVMYALLSLE